MKTMRERISKRICCPSGVCQGESLGACVGDQFLGDADAVLSELETPTEGMVEAGWANALGEDAAGTWASMIRAAKEGK